MVKIAPSILSADFSRLGEEIKAAEQAGADLIHIDIMDGHFVPNITIGPPVVKAIRDITTIPLDVHLMIEDPDRYISDFAKAGADMITIHAEASTHLHRSINYIKANNAKAGVSLNPATPPHVLDFVLSEVDMILVMSVNPGFGGQEFIPQSMDKIRKLKGDIRGGSFKILISVDGGVNAHNARDVVEAGADILVMGSAFFQSNDYEGVVQSVRKSVAGLHDTT
ncbi:MAG: ribulose-phosphate 3-epimerase [Nitrospiraceae bacterium]|nr:MAG: ribulose-phosphate 3-epimerase [Nitrospiraceae bacterium]